jgi:hypothetical protein
MRALAAHQAPFVARVLVLGTFGVIYLLMTAVFRVPEAANLVARLRRR